MRFVTFCLRFVLASGLLTSTFSLASPLLSCTIDQGGSTQILEFRPTSDPYIAKAFDINDQFRFKVVVIGNSQHIDYIKIYVYDFPSRQPVLLHEVKYPNPLAQPNTPQTPFTGIHYVYSPRLERELKYQCSLQKGTP